MQNIGSLIRPVHNFIPQGELEVSCSYNGVVSEFVREGHFVCCPELLCK